MSRRNPYISKPEPFSGQQRAGKATNKLFPPNPGEKSPVLPTSRQNPGQNESPGGLTQPARHHPRPIHPGRSSPGSSRLSGHVSSSILTLISSAAPIRVAAARTSTRRCSNTTAASLRMARQLLPAFSRYQGRWRCPHANANKKLSQSPEPSLLSPNVSLKLSSSCTHPRRDAAARRATARCSKRGRSCRAAAASNDRHREATRCLAGV